MATAPKSPTGADSTASTGKMLRELTARPAMAAALQWFARERAWINERHLELCRIPAPTFFEAPRAEWLRTELEVLGWSAVLDRAGNVIATLEEGARSPAVVVTAHLDTVFAPERPSDIHCGPDGRLYGPGTSDNGSGLSSLLALARVLLTSEGLRALARRVMLVANVGEEGEGNLSGMRYLCEHLPNASAVEAFLVLDGPSVEHITAQALASRRFEVSLTGPGGHSWNDHGAPNPIHVLAEAISAYVAQAEAMLPPEQRDVCSYNFGVIEGGTSVNSIPASARAKLDVRSEEPVLLAELSALLTAVLERVLEQANRAVRGSRLSARIKDLGARPGGKLAADAPLLEAIRAVDAQLAIRSRVDCASTDANVPLSLGFPALSIGTGGRGGGAHTAAEWYQPEGREVGLKRVLLLLGLLHEQATGGAQEAAPREDARA